MNTALYLLRCLQVGLRMADLEYLDYGMVVDIFTEANNDNFEYNQLANQADFDNF